MKKPDLPSDSFRAPAPLGGVARLTASAGRKMNGPITMQSLSEAASPFPIERVGVLSGFSRAPAM